MNIADYIPYGKENAISKKKLERLTGMKDREIRLEIKALVKKGIPILYSSGHRGYWISEDDAEIAEFIRETEHRCKTTILTLSNLKKGLYQRKNIRTVPVRQHLRRVHGSGISDNQIKMVL